MWINATDFHSAEEYEQAVEEATQGLATPTDARREYAHNAGAMFQDREWVLSPWDTWEPNPYYRGPKGPHPEDDSFWQASPEEQAAYLKALNEAPAPRPTPSTTLLDDVPF